MTVDISKLPDTKTPYGAQQPGMAARLAWQVATNRYLPREIRRRLRKAVAARFAGPFDVEADGVRLRVYPAENHCDRTVLGRGHLPEAPERALIAPLLKPGMVFVDIGANVGVYSLFVSERTQGSARVIAFEPHPRSFSKLWFNCTINGFGKINCINAAVGGQRGEASLFSDGGGNVGGASLRGGAVVPNRSDTVSLVGLAETLAALDIAVIDLLKIDVEGYEDEALLPLFEADAALWPRHILLETVHAKLWGRDVGAALRANGYRVSGETVENSLFSRM
ncbi:FkbM family methyltransferase [Mesorhizobium xinjiangense]|uniref:FkbM family methyltransferase n=1 Tax=Mesorhizobium xinjiangense TaxID=2678685 RepID=UPI0018DECB47|nr:FkbM family methyltransferase [Mesorhizobium xinjiangense]